MVKNRQNTFGQLDSRLYVGLGVISEELGIAKNRILDEALMLWFRESGYEVSDFEALTEKIGYSWDKLISIEEMKSAIELRKEGKKSKGIFSARNTNGKKAFKSVPFDQALVMIQDSKVERLHETQEENRDI